MRAGVWRCARAESSSGRVRGFIPSEFAPRAQDDRDAARQCGLEEAPVAFGDDHRADVFLVCEVVDAQVLRKVPAGCALLEPEPDVYNRVSLGGVAVRV